MKNIILNRTRLDVLKSEENKIHYVVALVNINNIRIILDETTKIAVEDIWINLYKLIYHL